MAASYHLRSWRRILNLLVRVLLTAGLGPGHTYLLGVRGRNTGRLYSTPVTLVEESRRRWIVSPYGEVNWVRNARARGRVILSRGSKSEEVKIVELRPEEAAPVLQKYVIQVPITRRFFDVSPESGLNAFILEAPRPPVFYITSRNNNSG